MFITLLAFLKNLFGIEHHSCVECGTTITDETAVPVNNAEDICANCYSKEMLKSSYDTYEIMYMER